MKSKSKSSLFLSILTGLASQSAFALNLTCWDKVSQYGDQVRINGYLNIDSTPSNPSGAPGYYYDVHGGTLMLSTTQGRQNLVIGSGKYSNVRANQSGDVYIEALSFQAVGASDGGHYLLISKRVQSVGGSGNSVQYQAVFMIQNGGRIPMACDTSGNSSPINPHPNH